MTARAVSRPHWMSTGAELTPRGFAHTYRTLLGRPWLSTPARACEAIPWDRRVPLLPEVSGGAEQHLPPTPAPPRQAQPPSGWSRRWDHHGSGSRRSCLLSFALYTLVPPGLGLLGPEVPESETQADADSLSPQASPLVVGLMLASRGY